MASSSAASGPSGPTLLRCALLPARMKELEAQGHVDPRSWKLPEGDKTVSNPPPGYIVATKAYTICGLHLPESDFLAGVLVHCMIELVNLTPNSILILAIFQHLCEGYLGILPTPSLFLHYSYLFLVELT